MKAAQWQWRKKYRVWEANRKVFVYPENFLEPDLRLPAACLAALCRVLAAVRAQSGALTQPVRNSKPSRPQGVPVLFIGKNPTGALVAAQTLAGELRTDLYRIDLSQVVSKYIDEAEKNLRRIFDATKQGGAVLLFDEADALFGTRSQVNDSHDRYAKIEINYLLERIEGFGGLAILSANNRRGVGDACARRFHFAIRLPK
jgi:SpoVK/Ycf46/Vps4 family AAA+-type ATPase